MQRGKTLLLASLGDSFQGIQATKKLFSTQLLPQCFFMGNQVTKVFSKLTTSKTELLTRLKTNFKHLFTPWSLIPR